MAAHIWTGARRKTLQLEMNSNKYVHVLNTLMFIMQKQYLCYLYSCQYNDEYCCDSLCFY